MGASDSRLQKCSNVLPHVYGEDRDMTWTELRCDVLKDMGERQICEEKEPIAPPLAVENGNTTLTAGEKEQREFSLLRGVVLSAARRMLGSTHAAAATCTMSLEQYAGFAATKLGVDYSDLIAQKLAELQSDGFRKSIQKWRGKKGKATFSPDKYVKVLKELRTQHKEIHDCYNQYTSLYPGKAGARERKPINEAYYPQMDAIVSRAKRVHERGRIKLALKAAYEGSAESMQALEWKSSPLPRSEHLFQEERKSLDSWIADLESEISKESRKSTIATAWTIVHLLSFNIINLALHFVYDLAKLPPLDEHQKDVMICMVSVYVDALWKKAVSP